VNRLNGLDTLRGIAIVLMVAFHFSYDLNYFGYIKINILHDPFWLYFRILIVSIFLFCVGISLALANKNGINWAKVKKRAAILGASAIAVSIGTYIVFPHGWVYFGILHAIFIFSLIGLFFINKAYISLVVGILILVVFFYFKIDMHPLFVLLAKPLHLPLHFTVDLVPVIPWFSVVLAGIALVNLNLHKSFFNSYLLNSNTQINSTLQKLGRKSLIIYLIHQPILFGLLYIIHGVTI